MVEEETSDRPSWGGQDDVSDWVVRELTGVAAIILVVLLVLLLLLSSISDTLLVLTAIAGVSATFWVYFQRRDDQRSSLRSALKSEIQQMDYLSGLTEDWDRSGLDPQEDKIPPELVPPADHLPTTIYEINASRLGYLPDEEVEKLVEFYSMMGYIKSLIQVVRNEVAESNNPDEALYGLLKKYSTMQPQLLEMLEGERDAKDVEAETPIRMLAGGIKTASEREEGDSEFEDVISELHRPEFDKEE